MATWTSSPTTSWGTSFLPNLPVAISACLIGVSGTRPLYSAGSWMPVFVPKPNGWRNDFMYD